MKAPERARDAAGVLLEVLSEELHEVEQRRAELNSTIATVRRIYSAAIGAARDEAERVAQ